MGLLRCYMKKNGDNVPILAKQLGIATSTLYVKLRGESDFTLCEMQLIARRYQLTPDEVGRIFFD